MAVLLGATKNSPSYVFQIFDVTNYYKTDGGVWTKTVSIKRQDQFWAEEYLKSKLKKDYPNKKFYVEYVGSWSTKEQRKRLDKYFKFYGQKS